MTISIPLTRGYVALIDDCDADLLEMKWQSFIAKSGLIYASHGTGQRTLLLHRIILQRMTEGILNRNQLTDHVNGNGLDCQRHNLRIATHAQNMTNRKMHSNNTSGYTGVNLVNGKWRARIKVDGKFIYLGMHLSPEAAHEAYKTAAVEYHGEFVRAAA